MLDEAWLSTVRMARDIGNISSLFPPGITKVYDLPYTLHNAITAALGFLTFEQLPEDERPPKRIWLNDTEMRKWWAEVKRVREAEMKGEGEMTQNTLKDKLLRGF